VDVGSVAFRIGDPQHPRRVQLVGVLSERLPQGIRVLDEQHSRVGLGERSSLHTGTEVADRLQVLRRADPDGRLGSDEHLLGGGLAHALSSRKMSCSQLSHITRVASASASGEKWWWAAIMGPLKPAMNR